MQNKISRVYQLVPTQKNNKPKSDQQSQIINNDSREIFVEHLPGFFPDGFQLEWLTDRLAED